jgi:DNA-binding transcriptional ArsR family regulator
MTNPEPDQQFSTIATLIGEPARAIMLWNMLDGRAYTAGELALVSNISPQSASNHLNKLIEADFLKVEKQGKHRYYRFAKDEVAYAIEAMANLIPDKKSLQRKVCINGEIQFCRTCYDHLAGKVAVDITQTLLQSNLLILEGNEFIVSTAGEAWFNRINIDLEEVKKCKRHFAKPCLDWTERKYHLGGALGAALLSQMKNQDWLRPTAFSRIVILTGKGESELSQLEMLTHG